MTDYNDGKWHVWDGRNGDKCAVHPDSRIDLQYWQGPGYNHDRAGLHDWQGPLMFRVTKPAPREFWIVGGCEVWDNQADAMNSLKAMRHSDIIHVREVMP